MEIYVVLRLTGLLSATALMRDGVRIMDIKMGTSTVTKRAKYSGQQASPSDGAVILARALPGQQGARDADGGVDMWRPRRDWAVFADAASLLPVYVVRFH